MVREVDFSIRSQVQYLSITNSSKLIQNDIAQFLEKKNKRFCGKENFLCIRQTHTLVDELDKTTGTTPKEK